MSDDLQRLLEEGQRARQESHLAEARGAYAEAVELGRLAEDPGLLVQALKRLGGVERDLGAKDAALTHYREAAALQRGQHDALGLAHTLRHLGDILREAGQLDAALPCYAEALAIYNAQAGTDASADALDLANALRGYALLRAALGERAEAAVLWREAGALYKQANIAVGVEESERQLKLLES
jgi:tetratricopeptide (TPR) repeat protein